MSPNHHHHQLLMATLIITLSLIHLASGQPHSWAENVCNESIPIKKDIVIEQPVTYEIKVQSMCGILPCVKTRTETKTNQFIKTVIDQTYKLTCCPGYVETPSRRCAPMCSDPCGSGGRCVEPNVCKCVNEPSQFAPGFTGSTCRRFVCLTANRWGASCERDCQTNCTANSYCSADTGKCVCEPGWHGPNCDLECGPDDSHSSGCNFMSQMPPIAEPDANLLVVGDNLILSRTQKAEALTLLNDEANDDVKIISKTLSPEESRAWNSSLASSYLLGLLSVMSMILLVAFLIVKKRYEFVRNELYHASVASIGRSGSTGSGPGSDYSTSTYYSATRAPDAKNLDNNLSFAAATRNILADSITNQADGKKNLLFSPKTESHLIRSQEASKQNIYSEIDLTKDNSIVANRARAKTPTQKMDSEDYDHIYQVPKRSPFVGANDSSTTELSNEPLMRPADVSVDLGYDNDSNIYEEIKPREAGDKGKM